MQTTELLKQLARTCFCTGSERSGNVPCKNETSLAAEAARLQPPRPPGHEAFKGLIRHHLQVAAMSRSSTQSSWASGAGGAGAGPAAAGRRKALWLRRRFVRSTRLRKSTATEAPSMSSRRRIGCDAASSAPRGCESRPPPRRLPCLPDGAGPQCRAPRRPPR